MTNTCPKTPYSKKTSPYSQKVSPFTVKQSPYSEKSFCPVNFLLQENGGHLLLQNKKRIII